MTDEALEKIRLQSDRGGVNRQQAELLLDRVEQLQDAIANHRATVEDDPDFDSVYHADALLWGNLYG